MNNPIQQVRKIKNYFNDDLQISNPMLTKEIR